MRPCKQRVVLLKVKIKKMLQKMRIFVMKDQMEEKMRVKVTQKQIQASKTHLVSERNKQL